MRQFACLLIFLLFKLAAQAQSDVPERRLGEIIVQISPLSSLGAILAGASQSAGESIVLQKPLALEWGIYLLEFEERNGNGAAVFAALVRTPGVQSVQWNHHVRERSVEPDDAEWWRQGDMVLINAPTIWEATTGGLTPQGDTIVVAVLEKGALLTHPDLAPNRWWNWHDTKNGVDDDGNGYVDDFGGWNPQTGGDDTGNNSFHGTAVHGIVGARGNNQIGIAGVNWNVKLMNISGMDLESQIIEGYVYVFRVRKAYNQTNGAKGAFVVATNASFGFDNWKAADHPIWCAMYDSLGTVGVLSVAATANQPVDVDVVGDMPTTCPSEYLISVTNINKNGVKETSAAYGKVHVDLGAPGTGTYSTYNSGGAASPVPSYNTINGCSAAAPHVTGGVALLYSLDCKTFTSDAVSNPSACARRVRDIIFDNVAPNPSLEGITVTGGHLDLGRALAGVRDLCDGATVGPLKITEVRSLANGKWRLYYQIPNFLPFQFRVFNMLGQLVHEQTLLPQQFGENYVEYDPSLLPRAVYVLAIGRGDAVVSRKFPKI